MRSALTGPVVVTGQDITAVTANSTTDVGSMALTNDGRAFIYAKNGAVALTAGKLCQSPAETTSGFQSLTIVNGAVGDASIVTSTTTTLTKDQLAGGYLTVISGTTGVGQTLRISGNPAVTGAAATINLDDPLQIATTGTAIVDVVASPYVGVIVNPATATGIPVGVSTGAVPANNYCWLQVRGICSVLADGTVVVGTNVAASNATAGAVEAATGVQALVGTAVTGIATTDYGLVRLMLA